MTPPGGKEDHLWSRRFTAFCSAWYSVNVTKTNEYKQEHIRFSASPRAKKVCH